MSELRIERLGGFGGFGLPGSAVRSQGTVHTSQLPSHVRDAVHRLFDEASSAEAPSGEGPSAEAPSAETSSVERDTFRYRITRSTAHGSQTIEVPESNVPEELQASVRDELI